jgi:ribosomal protein S18 acetylase RimI-like enzyme
VAAVADVRLEPMTGAQFRGYSDNSQDEYAKEIAESGSMSWDDAVQKAADDYARMLPQGLDTPDNFLFTAYDGEAAVGILWLMLQTRSDGPRVFIGDISVNPDARRQGYGRAIMTAAEDFARTHQATAIALNVFGQNVAAQELYRQLGYRATSIQMLKSL